MKTIRLKNLTINKKTRILDLGCGEGRHAIALAFEKKTAQILALDLSSKDLHTAREKEHSTSASFTQLSIIHWLQGDGKKLPFPDQSFDVVICSEVLEHIVDYDRIIEEASRVLASNGQLAISVPRAWPEKICWWLSEAYRQVPGGHVHILTSTQLDKQIVAHKFTRYFKHGAHALHVPYWWLKCLFWQSQDSNLLIRWYHRLLVWDMMNKPKFTLWIDKILNPFMGKSIVLYFRKTP